MRLIASETEGQATTEIIEISGEDLHRILEKALNCNIRRADFGVRVPTANGTYYMAINEVSPLTVVATTVEGERDREDDTDVEFIIIN